MTADLIELVDADPTWPARYAAEVENIRRALDASGSVLQYEHIGSTAVPGLAAKPIIDVLIIPEEGTWPDVAIRTALATLDYVWWDGNPNPRHLFFVKGMPPFGERRTHHVHVRPREDALPILTFRDRLRARPDLAQTYERLKRELAERFPEDREAYTHGKDAFVSDVLSGVDATAA